jgi:hypothetical protein
MKRAKGEMRPEYKRSDFPKLERGKFYADATAGTYVVILDPAIAKAFPTSKSVNEALAGLLASTEKKSRVARRPIRTRAKGSRTA